MPTEADYAEVREWLRQVFPAISYDSAEEAVENTMIAFWQNAPAAVARDPRKQRAWLHTVAARYAMRGNRAAARFIPFESVTENELACAAHADDGIYPGGGEYDLLDYDTLDSYARRLLRNNRRQFVAFITAALDDYNDDNMATMLGMTKNSYQQTRRRAIQNVRNMYKADERRDERRRMKSKNNAIPND